MKFNLVKFQEEVYQENHEQERKYQYLLNVKI